MSCAWAQNLLFDYLDGRLDETARARVEAHLAGCAECAGFAQALDCPAGDAGDFTRAVLRETATACEQSVERLPDWVDGALDALDGELVGGHVTRCAECHALAGVLRAMEADLPALAEVEPDARFLEDVLAATVRKSPRLSWAARLAGRFDGLLRRPRIAWEGAYVASVLLVLLAAIPGSPLAGMSRKAIEWVRTDPQKLEQPFVAFKAGLDSGTQEAWYSTRTAARSFVVRASAETGDAYRKARRGIGTLWDRIASDEVTEETQEQDREDS